MENNQSPTPLLSDILNLCMQINITTDYAVFYNISGHISRIKVWVGRDKTENFNDWIFECNLRYSDDDFEPLANKLIEDLKSLAQHRG